MIGAFKKFSIYGPVYKVVKLAGEDPVKGVMVEILVLESGEITTLPFKDVEEDPDAESFNWIN